MSCGAGHRHGSDPTLLLWHGLAAVALIQPLAWELPCATGVVLKRQKKKKVQRKKRKISVTEVNRKTQNSNHVLISVISFIFNNTRDCHYYPHFTNEEIKL